MPLCLRLLVVHRPITSPADQNAFQTNLDRLVEWAENWDMRFNTSKGSILRLSRSRKPHSRMYSLSYEILQLVDDTKYLGVNINKELSWSPHVEYVAHKTNKPLLFCAATCNSAQPDSRNKHTSLVRSVLEYGRFNLGPLQSG